MRVLSLWSAPYVGGAARRFVELTDGLWARHVDIVVLSVHKYVGCDRVPLERVSLPQGRFRTARTWLSVRFSNEVQKLLEKHKPDVVFAFGLTNASILCLLADRYEIPSVLFIRGMEITPEEYRHASRVCIPGLRGLGNAVYMWLFRRYARTVFRQVQTIVFQNREQHQAYLDSGLLGTGQSHSVHLLPNNSNPSWLPRRELFQPPKEPVTVIAANLYWGKGFRIALDAFSAVRKSVPNAQLMILGEGPEGEDIRRYSAEIGGVTFCGHVPDIHNYLTKAKLLLHPTLFEVGSPNIVLEAAGWGVPMIVSDETTHTVGKRIWAYPARDSRSLAGLWIDALTNDSLLERLCRESRELGEQYRFDWVAEAQKILLLASETSQRTDASRERGRTLSGDSLSA